MTDLTLTQSSDDGKGILRPLASLSDDQLSDLRRCVRHEIKYRKSDGSKNPNFYPKPEISCRGGSIQGIPDRAFMAPIGIRCRYLKSLLNQDWSHLWNCGNYSDLRKFYVYAHINPSGTLMYFPKETGKFQMRLPFYIGKGTGNRAYDLNRNQGHGLMIRKHLSKVKNSSDIVHIIKNNMTEIQALEFEAKLIYFFGTVYERPNGGILYNLDTSARPNFTGMMTSRLLPEDAK